MEVLKVAFLSGMVLELAASISIAMVAVQVGIRLIEGMMVFQTGTVCFVAGS
jgi:ATP-binding cassette, subfamily C, bacterial CydD